MAFSEMGTFHLCFILNWNKLINILELCFTTNLSKQNAAFLMCSGNRLSQISLSSKDSGVKEMFYHYMLLNLKVLSGFVSSPLLVFSPGAFPDTTPLVLSKHRTSSGSPLPRFLTSSLIYCFLISVLWNFLNLAFYTLCVLVLPIIFSISNNPLAISTMDISIHFTLCVFVSLRPILHPSLPCIPCTSRLRSPVGGISGSLEGEQTVKLGNVLLLFCLAASSSLVTVVSFCYCSSLWAA